MVRSSVSRYARDVGSVLAAWLVGSVLEQSTIAAGSAELELFSGSALAVVALSLVAGAPLAAIAVLLGRAVEKRRHGFLATLAGIAAVALAYRLSAGPRMASWSLRAPFILLVVGAAVATVWGLARRLPLTRPRLIAAGGVATALAAWVADRTVLPSFYPAFHAALFVLSLAGLASTYLAFRSSKLGRAAATATLGLLAASLALTPRALSSLGRDEARRRVLFVEAPMLGRVVFAAARFAPRAAFDEQEVEREDFAAILDPIPTARSLDWSGRDVVLITVDALRADHLGSYGYHRPTSPKIDALATRGVRFDRAYAPFPNTSYSVASLMTGQYAKARIALGEEDSLVTWAETLRRNGYRTAGLYPPVVFHFGAHHFRRMRETHLGFERHEEAYATAEERVRQVSTFLDETASEVPSFTWVHLFDPHEPYVAHPEFPFAGGEPIDAYDSEIAMADATIGRIVETVEERRPGSIVIVTADHGEAFGERGVGNHGSSVHEEQVRVPLIIVGRGVTPGVVVRPVQTIDIFPTVLAAIGARPPPGVRGRDLGPLLVRPGDAMDEGFAFAQTDEQTLVAVGDDRLVCIQSVEACALFDLRRDPKQLSADSSRPSRANEMRRLTEAVLRRNARRAAATAVEARRVELHEDAGREALERALCDVESRAAAIDALVRLGEQSAVPPLLATLARERYPDLRYKEFQALVALGVREPLRPLLERAAVAPEPMFDAIQFAALAGLLRPDAGGVDSWPAVPSLSATLRVRGDGPARLFVLTAENRGQVHAKVDGLELTMVPDMANLWTADLPHDPSADAPLRVDVSHRGGVRAIWIVRLAPPGDASSMTR